MTDLQTSSPDPTAPGGPAVPAGAAAGRKGTTDVEQLSRAQALVARRVAEARATVPDVTYAVEVDMGAALRLLAELPDAGGLPGAGGDAGAGAPGAGGGTGTGRPTAGDLTIRACALALREQPTANGAYKDGAFERYGRVNVGVVVPETAAAVPTLFDADAKDLRVLASERRGLTERVRAGTATPPELSGATFTVADLSEHGVRDFVPVVPSGQAAILAVGAVEERPVVRAGAVVAGHTLRLTLACDHRILHGSQAAALLRRIRELLEQPSALVS